MSRKWSANGWRSCGIQSRKPRSVSSGTAKGVSQSTSHSGTGADGGTGWSSTRRRSNAALFTTEMETIQWKEGWTGQRTNPISRAP
jgi:hypothetical protein